MVDLAWAEMAKFFWFVVRISVSLIVNIVEATKRRNQWGDTDVDGH